MKKSSIIVTALFLQSGILYAQKKWTPKNEFNIRVGINAVNGDNNGSIWATQLDYNRYLGKSLSLGIGLGAEFSTRSGEDGVILPIVLRGAYNWHLKNFVPYVSLQTGSSFYIGDDFFLFPHYATIFITPSVGIKIPMTPQTALDLSFGYTKCGFDEGYSYWGVKAGISFGWGHSKDKQLTARHEKRQSESGTAKENRTYSQSRHSNFRGGIEGEYLGSNMSGFYNNIHAMYGVRGYALWNIFTKNLYAGISAGIGLSDHEEWNNSEYYEHSHKFKFAIMPRVRYNITEATIAQRIYPFAQVDAGYAYNGTNSQFAVEPAAGISIKTIGSQSVDISVGYLPKIYFYGGDKSESGCARIAVGYTF